MIGKKRGGSHYQNKKNMKKVIFEKVETICSDKLEKEFFVGFIWTGNKHIIIRRWNDSFIPVGVQPSFYPSIWADAYEGQSIQEVLEKLKQEISDAFVFDSMEEMLLWAAKRD